MKKIILLALCLVSTSAFAKSYSCDASGTGEKTIDSFTLVKTGSGENATLEFHPVGAHKGWDLSPTSSGNRDAREHRPNWVEENGTGEYSAGANPQEFNKGISPDKNKPVFVSAIFVSQGVMQDKESGYVMIEFRYANGSGAAMHGRQYNCEAK